MRRCGAPAVLLAQLAAAWCRGAARRRLSTPPVRPAGGARPA
eukprot:gene7259-21124_t